MTILRSLLGVVDLSNLIAAGTVSDAFQTAAVNDLNAPVKLSLGQVLTWIQGHYQDLAALAPPIILSANTVLDGPTHNRRKLIATTALTLNLPGSFANLGSGFECKIINDSTGTLTWGSGITALATTLAAGQAADLVAYNNGTTNVVRVLVGGAASTAPSITLSGPSAVQFVPSGSSTVSVAISVALANYYGAPTLQYSVDGGSYAALPGGATVSSTAVLGLALSLGGGTHTVTLKDTGSQLVSNTLSLTVESDVLAGVPTTGWSSGAAHTLTGTTSTMAGITTAYAVLYNGSTEVGSRQAFTNSAGLAALSFIGSTGTTNTIRVYDALTGGNLLAESPTFTIAAPGPTLTFASISSTNPGTSATAVYNFANGLPTGATVSLDGSAATLTSGPTVATTSGSGATAGGTLTFALAAPAAGTHSLAVSTTGTYAATASAYSWVTTVVAQPLLDTLTATATAAFAFRRLRAAYSGACVQVSRSSDSTTQDIGFTSGGLLNTTALTNFIGSSDARIEIWYDQSGSGMNAVPHAQSYGNRSLLAIAGVVNLSGGKPAAVFGNSSNAGPLQAPFNALATGLSAAMVVQNNATETNQRALIYAPSTSATDYQEATGACILINSPNQDGSIGVLRAGNAFGFSGSVANAAATAMTVFDGTNGTFFCNGTQTGTAASGGGFSTTGYLIIGSGLVGGPSGAWGGPISEVIVFPGTITSGDRTKIQASQKPFYGTP